MIDKALASLRPGAQWALKGFDYDGITWLELSEEDGGQSMPTREEVDAEVQRLEAEWEAAEYQRKRRFEYPSWEVLADAIYHQANGDNTKMEAYLAACEAVKTKYPKGNE